MVAFVKHDDMIEQVATAVADEALSDAILPRAFEGSANGLHAKCFRRCEDLSAEGGISVVNQIAGRRVERECLAQLLTHPGAGWMSGHIEMKNSPPVMGDDEEAIENAKGECWHGEEVHGGDGFAVVGEKCRPTLRRFGVTRRLSHPAQDCPLGDVEAEHLDFTVYPWRSPCSVLRDHAENESTQLFGCWSSADANAFPRNPTPIQPEAGAMSADDRRRLDDKERLLPARPESAQDEPEQPVRHGETGLRMPLRKNSKLLPQSEILQQQIAAGAKEAYGETQQEPQRTKHIAVLSGNA